MVRSKIGNLNLHQIHLAILHSFSVVKHVFPLPLCLKLHFFIENCIWLFIYESKLSGNPAFAENMLFSSILWYLHATFSLQKQRQTKKIARLNMARNCYLLKKYEVLATTKPKVSKSVLGILTNLGFFFPQTQSISLSPNFIHLGILNFHSLLP